MNRRCDGKITLPVWNRHDVAFSELVKDRACNCIVKTHFYPVFRPGIHVEHFDTVGGQAALFVFFFPFALNPQRFPNALHSVHTVKLKLSGFTVVCVKVQKAIIPVERKG